MNGKMKVAAIAVVALSLSAGLVAGPSAVAKGPFAKCKKFKGKAKAKCIARVRRQLQGVKPTTPVTPTTPATPARSAITLTCADCAPYNAPPVFPVAHADSSNITINGVLSPPGAGSVTIRYMVGITPTIVETIPVDAAGNFTKTYTLNADDGFNNGFAADFAGDTTRTPTSSFLSFYQY